MGLAIPREIDATGRLGRSRITARLGARRYPQPVDGIGGEGVAGEAHEARGIGRFRAREGDEERRGLPDKAFGERNACARRGGCGTAFRRCDVAEDAEIGELAALFEKHFHVDLGNVYHAFGRLRGQQNPTAFLDEMKERLLKKMRDMDSR